MQYSINSNLAYSNFDSFYQFANSCMEEWIVGVLSLLSYWLLGLEFICVKVMDIQM